ncbi:hypothetical protein B5M47_02865 [candidate division CPR3 bacterium 4484_211]|uniref:Glycosyltransferase 2-like domain-containing protein n=1 Tax=candidate division CPR3 bacterium 4484_211 TaxID=1968527 RepID=A0A1W9NXK8_UNCC3|nr:MAG: hypothetical protein B5M47_02865 [candidate division CPR3 bacterium 4484_211]
MDMTYVVVPTYNEAENIESLLKEILSLNLGVRILIVDDNSPDGTGRIAEELSHKNSLVEVMKNPAKAGLGRAYLKGFWYVLEQGAQKVVTMDADFSHRPREIPSLLEKSDAYDVVVGSRHVPGAELDYPWFRKMVSLSAVSFARWLLGLGIKDCTSAFRVYNRRALKCVLKKQNYSDGYIFLVELLFRLHKKGYTMVEVPIVFKDRERGRSKMAVPEEIMNGVYSLIRLKIGSILP